VYGLSEDVLQHNVALGGDNALLATLVDVSRQAIRSREVEPVKALTQFEIRHTLPGLQHDLCTLWNELVQGARIRGSYTTPVRILCVIRHLYIALHRGTDAAPTAFSASTHDFSDILYHPSSYPLCNIASHRPDSTAHLHFTNSHGVSVSTQPGDLPDASPHPPSHGGSTISRQSNQPRTTAKPPSPSDPTTPSEIGVSSPAPAATSTALPIHTTARPTDASPSGTVAAVLQDILPVATSSHPLEGTTQPDIVAPCAGPDIKEILSIASTPTPTPTLAPALASTSPVLSSSLASCDAGAASTSNPFPPASSVSIPASPTPSSVPPLPDPDLLLASAPSAAGIAPTSTVCSDDPTAQIHPS
jgi:hypothetical protein